MKRSLIIFLFLYIFLVLSPNASFAVTITAAPGTAIVGQSVTINANATIGVGAGASCNLNVNYGDGTATSSIGSCPPSQTCSFSNSHAYTSPGSYTITISTGTAAGGPCPALVPPATATTMVSVTTLSVSTVPSQANIPQGQSSSTGIQYQFRSTPPTNTRATSSSGTFIGRNGSVLSTNNTTVSASVAGGFGSATETIVVPAGLIERVLQTGQGRFTYRRVFSVAGAAIGTANVDFVITTDSAASLGIKKIDLYFENRRPEITIEKGHKGLKAFADISYIGSGLFEGYWEVDGRVISRVFQQLSFGGLLKLQTPEIPELPTFDPGTHRIRFVILRPTQPVPTPAIIYFVNLDRFKPALSAIGILLPQDRASVGYGPLKFEWQRPANTSVFLVQYGDKLESKAIFSAYTRDAFYVLPEDVLKANFKAGERYYWKVIGFDEENNIIGESAVYSFTFTTISGMEKKD